MDIKKEISILLKKRLPISEEEIKSLIEIPLNNSLGDYSFPCFKISSLLKEKPEKIANTLSNTIPDHDLIFKTEVKGPYLNFFIDYGFVARSLIKEILVKKDKFGSSSEGKNKKVIVEFSSPNIAKPFNIGHLRSTVIGNSLYKIYSFLGYKCISINHLGDYGTQFGALILAYKKYGNDKLLEKDPINYSLDLYIKIYKEIENNENLKEEAKLWFKKLENKDKEAIKLWKKFRDLSLKYFEKIYNILDIKFDEYTGESFYQPLLEQTISQLEAKKFTEINDNALVVNLEKYNMPPLILKKSDEASTYATRDLAAALYRIKKFNPEKILYVVGSEQKLHFLQFFKVLELLDYDKNKFVHIPFGLVRLSEGKLSTRKGKLILLEEVLNKAIDLAKKIIEHKNPKLKNKEEIANRIGIGSIIFADLINDRNNDVVFEWDKILDFEGNTAPYLQYTYVRCISLLKKTSNFQSKMIINTLKTEYEKELIKKLNNFEYEIKQSAIHYKPSILSHYLIELARSFNEFYHFCPILKEDIETKNTRLLIVKSIKQVLENGLNLLGIKTVDQM